MNKWKPNEEQFAVLEELAALQKKEKSISDFVRKLPGSWSLSRWTRIMGALDPEAKESYFDAVSDPQAVMAEVEDALRELQLDTALRQRGAHEIYPLKQFRAVAQAVRECRSKQSPERVVKYLSPTGGAKTYLAEYLADLFHATVVETREAWKRSYYTVLVDICRAVRLRAARDNHPTRLEDKLIARLAAQSQVLVFDEAEFFGPSALNGIKLLLNKTRVTIVICAIPEAHEKWNRSCPMEAEQIARRTHAVVELTVVDPVDAALFFPADQFEDRSEALARICLEASAFGHYSFVNRMAVELQGSRKADVAEVTKAMQKVRRQMQRETAAPSLPAKR
jgi:hypothetical protein